MKAYQYSSVFSAEIESFIAFKASVGISSNSRNWTLLNFDRWCVENSATVFSKETVESWVKYRKSVSSEHLSWMSHIRELGRYMRAHNTPDAYVLSDEFKAKMVRVTPYLLAQNEVDVFFSAAARFKPQSPWAWQAVCFFGLMHSCGLRTCEVQRLRCCDVDAQGKSLDIMWSKGNRSRRLAITDEVVSMLMRCDAKNNEIGGMDRSTFFITGTGNAISSASVGKTFARIWSEAGLPKSKEGKRPRPYDLRHRFAYANIERWGSAGKSVEAMLPYLAKYMGHATFDSTYYYIHTSPDFLADYAEIIHGKELLLPEVGFDV